MPRGDGTGPRGTGPMTGRGLGICSGANLAKIGAGLGIGWGLARGCGLGRGFGRGIGRALAFRQVPAKTDKEFLEEQKSILKNQLENIEKELEDL